MAVTATAAAAEAALAAALVADVAAEVADVAALDALVADRSVKTGFFSGKLDYAFFDNKLSKESKGKTYYSEEQKLVKLFFETTKEILTTKFGIKN